MKKSKIIIPALAIIAFSTAASITGSVAWFTASRQANISGGSYTVVKTNADLQCKVEAGVATSADDDTKTISMGSNKLTDGSFNHNDTANPVKNYIYAPNDAGTEIEEEIDLEDDDLADLLCRDTTNHIYTAATWKVSFTVSFGAVGGDYALLLKAAPNDVEDTNYSQFTVYNGDSLVSDTSKYATARGFRLAFIASTNDRALVYGDLRDFSGAKRVTGTNNYSGTGYTASNNDYVGQDYTTALPTGSYTRDAVLARKDYLGTFTYQEGTQVTLSYTVVAWFEGTDEDIKNRNKAEDYQTVKSKLVFEAVSLPAATPVTPEP